MSAILATTLPPCDLLLPKHEAKKKSEHSDRRAATDGKRPADHQIVGADAAVAGDDVHRRRVRELVVGRIVGRAKAQFLCDDRDAFARAA